MAAEIFNQFFNDLMLLEHIKANGLLLLLLLRRIHGTSIYLLCNVNDSHANGWHELPFCASDKAGLDAKELAINFLIKHPQLSSSPFNYFSTSSSDFSIFSGIKTLIPFHFHPQNEHFSRALFFFFLLLILSRAIIFSSS